MTNLKQAPLFRNVDTLAPARKKEWVDPKLVMPDHHFALTLDLVENEFQIPATGKGKIQSPPASRDVKPAPRTFKQKAETRFPSKEY